MDDRLYVKIQPVQGPDAPTPHPVRDGQFDVRRAYKVLGVYDSDGDVHFILTNPAGQIWFIGQQHLRAAGLHEGVEPSIPLAEWYCRDDCQPADDLDAAEFDEHPALRRFVVAPSIAPAYASVHRSAAAE